MKILGRIKKQHLFNNKGLSFVVLQREIYVWILANKYALTFLALTALGLRALYFIPYVNIALSSYLLFLIFLFFAVFTLKIKSSTLVMLGLLLFLLAFLIWLLGAYERAETLAEYIFIILLASVFKGITEK